MWARVKAETEQALLSMPWRSAHMFRPGVIEPLEGVVSGVRSYRILYAVMGWGFPLLRRIAPNAITTSVILGRALVRVGRDGYEKIILEGEDINRAGAPGGNGGHRMRTELATLSAISIVTATLAACASSSGASGSGSPAPVETAPVETSRGGDDAPTASRGEGLAIVPKEGDYALAEATVRSSTCGATRFLSSNRPEAERRFHVRGNDVDGTIYLLVDGRGQVGTMDASIAPNAEGEPVFVYEVDGEDWSTEGNRACVLHSVARVVGRVTGEESLTLDVTLAVSAPSAERSGTDTTFDPALCQARLADERGATGWDLSPCETRYRLALTWVAAP